MLCIMFVYLLQGIEIALFPKQELSITDKDINNGQGSVIEYLLSSKIIKYIQS